MQTNIPQSVIQTSEDEFHTSLELDFVPCEALNLTLIYYNHVGKTPSAALYGLVEAIGTRFI